MTSQDGARRAVIYVRLSNDRTGAGVSVTDQQKQCRDLAGRLGLDVIEPVRDDNDLTAAKTSTRYKGRPGYELLLGDLKEGRADAVLAWHTDRLLRDMGDLEGYIGVCGIDPGIPTYTVRSGNLDLTTASGRMVARILGAVQQQEVEHMIERLKNAKNRDRQAGKSPGGPRPFGYQHDKEAPGGMRIEPAEAAAIRAGYASLLEGKSLGYIAGKWNAQGLRTPEEAARGGGSPWTGSKVGAVLRRGRNAAIVEWQRRDDKHRRLGKPEVIGPGKWEFIVDEDTWLAARAILDDPSRVVSGGRKPKSLLTGNNGLICGVCKGTLFRVQAIAGKPPVYACCTRHLSDDGRHQIRGCTARSQERLDAFAERLIIDKLRGSDIASLARPAVDVAALDSKRTVLSAQLAEFASQPGIRPQELAIACKPLLAELQQVEEAISGALRGSPLGQFAGGKDPEDVWDNDLTLETRRAVVKEMLRIELLPSRKRKVPPGWRPGMRFEFDESSVRVTTPDGVPWGDPDG